MADRYKRFLSSPLAYAQLAQIAADIRASGYHCAVIPLGLTPEALQEGRAPQGHGLVSTDFDLSANTIQTLHWFETGLRAGLDACVDRLLLDVLKTAPADAECTCSHCFSHTADNSDVAGLWAPNPSLSCAYSALIAVGEVA